MHFFTAPQGEQQQEFYSRYAGLVAQLKKVGWLSQLVSATTELGIIYTICFSSLVGMFPGQAQAGALIGALVGTLFIELGLRQLLPYSIRAIVKKRFQGLDGWLSGFVIAGSLLLLIVSGILSFQGSKSLIETVAPAPELQQTTTIDNSHTATVQATKERYNNLIQAAEQRATASILELDNKIAVLSAKERKEGKSYTTAKSKLYSALESAKANKLRVIAGYKEAQAKELAALAQQYSQQTTEIASENKQAKELAALKIQSYGGNLGWFTVFALLVLVLCVTVTEIFQAGAGIEAKAQPNAYTFRSSAFGAFLAAIQGRWQRFLFGLVESIEQGTKEATEPLAAPTIWQQETAFNLKTTKGKQRAIRASNQPATEQETQRKIGFTRNDEQPSNATAQKMGIDALTYVVKAKNEPISSSGACDNCGNSYTQKTSWQRFCSSACRLNFHATKHGGSEYRPSK